MTPNPSVVIEMPASDTGGPFAQVLVDACSEGLGTGAPCALEEATLGASAAHAVAIVSWDAADRTAATVQVAVKRVAHAEWRTRRVAFAPADAEIERWRSLGLIVATLVGEQATHPISPEKPSPPPVAAQPSSPPPDSPPRVPLEAAWFAEAGAVTARGASDVLGSWGASVRGGATLPRSPFFLTASFRYELESPSSQVHLEWGWGAVGIGLAAPLGDARLLVEGRVEPTLGFVRASTNGAPAQSGLLFGVREGAALTWWWARWIGPSLSVDLLETTRATSIEVTGETGSTPVARAQWMGWSAGLGLRVRAE